MTYIEFFDKPDIDNVLSCLVEAPDTVVFIGKNTKRMNKRLEKYKKVFEGRGCNINFVFKSVSQGNLAVTVDLLAKIVNEYDDCHFNIDGGEEILNVALGVVIERYKDKNIQVHKYNLFEEGFYDCDNDGETLKKGMPQLSVEENVRIYGGELVYEKEFGGETAKWNLSNDFICDVNLIWGISMQYGTKWNDKIKLLNSLNSNKSYNEPLAAYGEPDKLEETIDFIKELYKKKLITAYEYRNNTVRVVYKNVQVRKCLAKAGMALEMKIYTIMKQLKNNKGEFIYNDVLNGVFIDWDGEFHTRNERAYDTQNEIDVMAMRGVVPVFVSCKNGQCDANELYKLSTVAERFGGNYAKKILVATHLSEMKSREYSIKQRAEDMQIRIVEVTKEMSDSQIAEKLKGLWRTN